MDTMPTREGAVVLLEDARGRIAFQLRDDRPDVLCPGHWGLFGGWLEAGETPEQGIRREMDEELGLSLETARLEYVKLHRDRDVITHIFRYPVPGGSGPAILREGQRLDFLQLVDLQERKVVPRHRAIIEWYAINKRTA
jgi:8-oxo-dGTP diphosphatase